MDITGLQALEEIIKNFHHKNVTVLISGANPRVTQKLDRAGIIHLVGEENVFKEFDDALRVSLNAIDKISLTNTDPA